jgi:exosortase
MLEKRETNWMPFALMLGSAILVFGYMYFGFGYATGYMETRATLWFDVKKGYTMDAGEWAFGYFVPPAALVLLWVTRDRFVGLTPKSSWLGLAVVAFACFIYFGGYKANEKYVGYASGQLMIAGLILWFLGWDYFKKGFWLWVLLGLMWPLVFLIEPISFPLRKLMTVLTSGFLSVIGEDVIRDGTRIMSAPTPELIAGERFDLGVAAACSGLRSLFALGMVSLLYGYLSLEKGWHRFLLAAAAVPFAVIGNFVRMILLYVGTITLGKEVAIGKDHFNPSGYHIGAGIAVFIVALACMMILVTVLRGGFKTLRRRKARVRQVEASGAVAEVADPDELQD